MASQGDRLTLTKPQTVDGTADEFCSPGVDSVEARSNSGSFVSPLSSSFPPSRGRAPATACRQGSPPPANPAGPVGPDDDGGWRNRRADAVSSGGGGDGAGVALNARANALRRGQTHSPSPPAAFPLVESASPAGSQRISSATAAGTSDLYSLQSPTPDAGELSAPSPSPSGSASASGAPVGGGGGGDYGRASPAPLLPLGVEAARGTGLATSSSSVEPLPVFSAATSTGGMPSPSTSPSPPVNFSQSMVGPSNSSSLSVGSSASGSGGNAGAISAACLRRSINPAFLALSPRADSEDSVGSDATTATSRALRLETDKGVSREVFQCDLTSLEDRKAFVTQRCAELARKMTSARIVESLLPALLTAFECDDYSESFDNCAPSIAKVLPDIIEALDDRSTSRVRYFMGLLMELCCSAENTVLREVSASIGKILLLLRDEVVVDLFLPLVLSMRVSYWSTPRAIAASLLGLLAVRPAVVEASGMNVSGWFDCFVESSSDPSVLVREAAVQSLHQWIDVADAHRVPYVDIPLSLVHAFITDDLSDAVRYLLVQELRKLAKLMGREATSKHLQAVYMTACGDPSWRVRFIAAQCMGDLVGQVSKPDIFTRVLVLLAEDEEPQIRAAIARQIPALAENLSPDALQQHCVPVALRLGEDVDPIVRGAAVESFASLLVLDSEEVARTVCEGILRLMEDPSFAVQVEAIRSLENIISVLEKSIRTADARAAAAARASSPEDSQRDDSPSSASAINSSSAAGSGGTRERAAHRHHHHRSSPLTAHPTMSPAAARHRAALVVQSFVERLERMSDAGNWRLRDAVVHILRFFCLAIKEDGFGPLTHVIRVLLRDPVSEVRSRAVATLKVVASHYGAEWAAQTTVLLLHEDFAAAQQHAYVWRLTAIQCLGVLLPVVSGLSQADLRRQQLLSVTTDLLRQYTADPVPNVRITLARAMPQWRAWYAPSPHERQVFNDAEEQLRHDPDPDVALAASTIAPFTRAEAPAAKDDGGTSAHAAAKDTNPY